MYVELGVPIGVELWRKNGLLAMAYCFESNTLSFLRCNALIVRGWRTDVSTRENFGRVGKRDHASPPPAMKKA